METVSQRENVSGKVNGKGKVHVIFKLIEFLWEKIELPTPHSSLDSERYALSSSLHLNAYFKSILPCSSIETSVYLHRIYRDVFDESEPRIMYKLNVLETRCYSVEADRGLWC